jgi:hypothetical protein
MRTFTIFACLLGTVAGSISPALADITNQPISGTSDPLAPVGSSTETESEGCALSPADARAAEWYARAEEQWAAGDLRGARASMQRAYDSSGRAELLFNLAQLSREIGECEPAVAGYRAYLRAGLAGRAVDARRALAELEASCVPRQAERRAAQPLPAPPVEAPYWTTARITGWSALGAGTLAALGATYFAFSAAQAEDDLEGLRASTTQEISPWDQAARDREREGEHAAVFAQLLGATALALVAGGTALVLTNPTSAQPRPVQASIDVVNRRLQAVYRVAF